MLEKRKLDEGKLNHYNESTKKQRCIECPASRLPLEMFARVICLMLGVTSFDMWDLNIADFNIWKSDDEDLAVIVARLRSTCKSFVLAADAILHAAHAKAGLEGLRRIQNCTNNSNEVDVSSMTIATTGLDEKNVARLNKTTNEIDSLFQQFLNRRGVSFEIDELPGVSMSSGNRSLSASINFQKFPCYVTKMPVTIMICFAEICIWTIWKSVGDVACHNTTVCIDLKYFTESDINMQMEKYGLTKWQNVMPDNIRVSFNCKTNDQSFYEIEQIVHQAYNMNLQGQKLVRKYALLRFEILLENIKPGSLSEDEMVIIGLFCTQRGDSFASVCRLLQERIGASKKKIEDLLEAKQGRCTYEENVKKIRNSMCAFKKVRENFTGKLENIENIITPEYETQFCKFLIKRRNGEM